MKKIIILLLTFIFIGCTNEEVDNFSNIIDNSLDNMLQEPSYVDTNPIKVGLYQDNKLVKEINKKFENKTDIAVLNILYTNDELLKSSNLKTNWNNYYQQYEDIEEYKIGFYVSFEANNKLYENLLLDPSNQHKLHPYLYLYLYDDIHQNGGFYSHLTMDDIKDNTIYSSIKLFLLTNANEISSPITLSVFTYKDENDFIDGKYRGNSIYTIQINNK